MWRVAKVPPVVFFKMFYKNIEVYEYYEHFNLCSYPGVDLFKGYLKF